MLITLTYNHRVAINPYLARPLCGGRRAWPIIVWRCEHVLFGPSSRPQLSRRQGNSVGLLVVYHFRGGNHIISSLRTLCADGKIVYGGLVGLLMSDTFIYTDGISACRATFRDQQCDFDGIIRGRYQKEVNRKSSGVGGENILWRNVGDQIELYFRTVADQSSLWMLKLTITEFFKRLTLNIWTKSHERMLVLIRWFLAFTFLGIVIMDVVECHPFTHYWQVVPDPGPQCRQGLGQLMMMGVANIVSDVLLVAFPIPIIIGSRMPVTRKIQLVLLFAGSLIPAGTTIYRLPNVIDRHGSQQYRSLLASIEILFATAVANALILGSFVRDRGVKKHRYKFGSTSDSLERTSSRRGTIVRHWGSDEDLVRDLGIRVHPELRDPEAFEARPAPMATAGNAPVKSHKIMEHDWHFPGGSRSDTSDDIDLMKNEPSTASSIITPRRVSFFDVGGLLDDDRPRRQSSTRTMDTDGETSSFGALHSIASHEGLSPPPPPRKNSTALHDVGGVIFGTRPKKTHPYRGYELHTILQERSPHLENTEGSRLSTTQSLQDVGGLLSK